MLHKHNWWTYAYGWYRRRRVAFQWCNRCDRRRRVNLF